MRHGISFRPPDTDSFAHWCRCAEELGFDAVFIPDTQSLYREVYVSCAICAMETSEIIFGPCVTNPVTRHPAVAASAIGTISELSGGRAFWGIATGDSAVLNLGLTAREARRDARIHPRRAGNARRRKRPVQGENQPAELAQIPRAHPHRRGRPQDSSPRGRGGRRRHHRNRPHPRSHRGHARLHRRGRQEIRQKGGGSGSVVAGGRPRGRRRRDAPARTSAPLSPRARIIPSPSRWRANEFPRNSNPPSARSETVTRHPSTAS